MENLVEEFLQCLRNERGQSELTQKTYAFLLGQFIRWAERRGLTSWGQVELAHLTEFLADERQRPLAHEPEPSARRLTSDSLYLEIAARRSFYGFASGER